MYIHMKNVKVKIGDRVNENTFLGEIGTQGNPNWKGNPHMHIVLRKNGRLLNPMDHLGFLQ